MTDTIDYGPLTNLIGHWSGDQGMDVSPEPDESAQNPYSETLMFEAIGEVENAESQELACLRYHQVVTRKRDNKVFHNESGYLTWDAASDTVSQALTIPRGVAVVAWGRAEVEGDTVRIHLDEAEIAQSPFMAANASTRDFVHTLELQGDELKYSEAMTIEIYGQVYSHTDANTLYRQD